MQYVKEMLIYTKWQNLVTIDKYNSVEYNDYEIYEKNVNRIDARNKYLKFKKSLINSITKIYKNVSSKDSNYLSYNFSYWIIFKANKANTHRNSQASKIKTPVLYLD